MGPEHTPPLAALHSTHEAAEKIAGIGAVLDGILPLSAYRHVFSRDLLVGAYHFPLNSPLDDPQRWRVYFDTNTEDLFQALGQPTPDQLVPLKGSTCQLLRKISRRFGVRLVFGQRLVGGASAGTWAYVLLANPQGVKSSAIRSYRRGLKRLAFNLPFYESFPAISSGADHALDRLLRADPQLETDLVDIRLLDVSGQPVPGGIHFINGRGSFPPIHELDSFQDFYRHNHYLIELQFYLYAAPALWLAAKAILQEEWGLNREDWVFFAHDWIGVPLYWAMELDTRSSKTPLPPARSIYFAHEARLARMLVEGVMQDKFDLLKPVCHPDGHDVAFYNLLRQIPADQTLAKLFPGSQGFADIYYHRINQQAARFDRVLAVGEWVKQETELICRGIGKPVISLCPNGVPNLVTQVTRYVENRSKVHHPIMEQFLSSLYAGEIPAQVESVDLVQRANDQLKQFARPFFDGHTPDLIFTSVNRCELSKAPWRNVEFCRRFASEYPHKKVLFIWLVRPKPLPTSKQVAAWAQRFNWPLEHQYHGSGGDLRSSEEALWQVIYQFNRRFEGHFHILYINQFGWSKELLGALDPGGTTFQHLRLGTEVELGLSIYEPYGIAPLEPFSAGAVCVLSDACGCALHLECVARDSAANGFVVGNFIRRKGRVEPAKVDLAALGQIEDDVYARMAHDLSRRLSVSRSERLRQAQTAMEYLSWDRVVQENFLPAVSG
ncbi:MAG: hypothetical protein JXB15_16710 [Anaerolineales bacterium]|nr:hypothetical protein [Anaerolineales bacterium]